MPRRTGQVKPRDDFRISFAPMRRQRLEMRIGQRELAGEARVHVMTILRLEKDRVDPRLSVMVRITRALGIPLSQLIEILEG